ncbi:MAG: hypothetical protein Q9218_003920 [Villophora microphyllina]
MLLVHALSVAAIAGVHHVAGSTVFEPLQQPLLDPLSSTASGIRKALQRAEVVPDVLDKDFIPLYTLNITYPGTNARVDLGNKIRPAAVSVHPNVGSFPVSSNNIVPTPTTRSNATETWALVLTDPDATSRSDPTKAEMCHWIVIIEVDPKAADIEIQVPMDSEAIGDVFKLETVMLSLKEPSHSELMSYYPPAPPPKTGYHRYIFVLLTPKPGRKMKDIKKPQERPHWGYGKVGKGVRDWAADNGLTPTAANFFYARNKRQ